MRRFSAEGSKRLRIDKKSTEKGEALQKSAEGIKRDEMNTEYLRTAKKSYMIVKGADYPFEEYEMNMILRNDISCLIPFQMILADGAAEYWYDVSGMQSLKNRFLLESVDGKQLRFFLESLMGMKSAMEEYLLDDANICFSAEMVCLDRSGERIRFCYIPGLGASESQERGDRAAAGNTAPGLRELFEEILQHLNHSDPVAVRMGYEMYERAARSVFSTQDCLDCLRIGESVAADIPDMAFAEREIRWKEDAADFPDGRADTEGPDEMEFLFEGPEQEEGHRRRRKNKKRADTEYDSGRERKKRRFRGKEQREEEEMLFAFRPDPQECPDIPDVPADSGRTEVIREDHSVKVWELAYRGDGMESDITISQSPFLVGTDVRKVNSALRARTVSRVHARLYTEQDRLFVEDFNSTNGTYLNHNLLPMSTPAELKEGDRIVFATEEFAVCCRRTSYR